MAADLISPIVSEDVPSLADRAYASLREAIIDGRLAAGAKLSERSLAAALGVSPQPVREALRRLESEGLAEARPRSGSFVTVFTVERLVEMGLMRAALETVAAGIAARRRTDADIAALRACMTVVDAASAANDDRRLAAANDALHAAIHAITGNLVLIRNLQALRGYYHISSRLILVRELEIGESLKEHTAVVEAIIAGDRAEAERQMHHHTHRNLRVAFPGSDI
ncbi:GntR family transcriptional regulator [Siculibacillus lacustris]|uniref:GntR family transcriptional regulator n=1 Tax=Siculibacillus lacustris TaxID=1549641 RepID=A0A4Q9VSQ1_9HYPH|nr:GntR family transcriptional regulator [Siculibacillus lacustris]TBW39022.1 GntR family transcriptional regulator [Siculibacillus lacustris]